jgi:hypothetical protein
MSMKASRLQEVLDESLSAYLDGTRTVEESLSLYPDVRRELEPLLRTAVELAEAYREPPPPPRLQERGRQEFLNNASVRRRARELTQDVNFSRRLARAALGRPQAGFIAVLALTFAAVATAVLAFDSSSRDDEMQAVFVPSPVSPAISDLRHTQELLRDQVTNQALGERDVSPEFFRELAERTSDLEAQVGEFDTLDEQSQRELQRAIGYQARLLRLMVDSQPAANVAPAAYEALGLTEQLAGEWGVDLPETPLATLAASPASVPTQAPGGATSPSPGESASPVPTPQPATPTPPPPPAEPHVP